MYLMPAIEDRTRRTWLMELAIVQNPHTKEPNELWARLRGDSALPDAKLNKTAMEQFKQRLAQKSDKMKIK